MIRNPHLVEEFERRDAQRLPADHARNLRIYEAMYEHARRLGAFPLADRLDGIEVDLRLARILNVRSAS